MQPYLFCVINSLVSVKKDLVILLSGEWYTFVSFNPVQVKADQTFLMSFACNYRTSPGQMSFELSSLT